MADSSSMVIKVKHGDSLRRFRAQISGNDDLNLTMDGLRNKIASLFSFAPDTALILTYVDEDDDVVTLADDDDLRDAVKQGLKPLRITAKTNLSTSKAGVCGTAAKAKVSNQRFTNKPSPAPAPAPAPGAAEKVADRYPKPPHLSLSGLTLSDKKKILLETVKDKGTVENSIGKGARTGSFPYVDGFRPIPIVNHADCSWNSCFQPGICCDGCGVLPITGPRFKSKVKDDYDLCSICFENMGNATDYIRMDGIISHKGYSGNELHYGIGCDGCGVLPITGPRFKSKVKVDYDLCRVCFKGMGNDTDYIRMDRSISRNDYSGNVFHCGVICDGCGVLPITGPRFKSKVKVDYDLCSICFKNMGSATDYIRMDRPAFYRSVSTKALQEARAMGPTFQQKVKPVATKLDSCFIKDVNIFDGTVMAPLTPFTKIWRMRNNGTVAWPEKTKLVWIGGDKLSNEIFVEVPKANLMIDEEFEVAVDFISPELPGRYISYWSIALPSGQKFGQRVWVLIQVDSSLVEAPPLENVRNLNLNLPPVNTTVPEIINAHPQPIVEDVSFGPTIPKKREDPVQQLNTEQELQFPINNSLLVGDGSSSSLVVSHPIDLADVVPAVPSMGPTGFDPVQGQTPYASAPPVVGARKIEDKLPEMMVVEEKLLKELEEMGFKEVDLNKQMLRMNGYDLVQAVDDLCGVSEWDSILEELQEMGFHDMKTNKMLLKKNNGSIKRVVMDLIAGEKIE